MKNTLRLLCISGLCVGLPVKVWSKACPGGHQCAEPHECCVQGCCLPRPTAGYRPPVSVDDYYVINAPVKYYLWLLLTFAAVVLFLVMCCRMRQQLRWWRSLCGCAHGSRSSEADSAGSCYYPPQYSRCGSLCRASVQPAPPPYNEVTSKPDLYPMVIYIGADKGDGDFMVQYFKNYIVRPPGSLSATSTADSLSSSYFCNTANEANSIIPPPYSCAGSVEWPCAPPSSAPHRQALLRSISSVTCHEYSSPARSLHTSDRSPPSVLGSQSSDPDPGNLSLNVNNSPSSVRTPSDDSQVFLGQNPTKTALPHSLSVPNNRILLHSSDAQSSVRGYSQDSADADSQFRAYRDTLEADEADSNPINSLIEKVSARVQINKYFNGNSCDFVDENNQFLTKVYTNFTTQESNSRKPDNAPNMNERSATNAHSTSHFSHDYSQPYSEDARHCNAAIKVREYSFHDSSCERNTSAFNLHSLEDNHCCQLFSHSAAEAPANVSSDYSNFAKNINNFGSKDEMHRTFSVGNSMTGSDISSLANLGTPDSPPRATSPTSEFKELLDKIQQLPNESEDDKYYEKSGKNADSEFTSDVNKAKRYFCKSRKSSLYMPLNLTAKNGHPSKVSPTASLSFKRQFARKGWLSRSAPTTPCGNGLVPNILTVSHRSGATASGRSSRISRNTQADDSPLLTEQDVSGDEGESFN